MNGYTIALFLHILAPCSPASRCTRAAPPVCGPRRRWRRCGC